MASLLKWRGKCVNQEHRDEVLYEWEKFLWPHHHPYCHSKRSRSLYLKRVLKSTNIHKSLWSNTLPPNTLSSWWERWSICVKWLCVCFSLKDKLLHGHLVRDFSSRVVTATDSVARRLLRAPWPQYPIYLLRLHYYPTPQHSLADGVYCVCKRLSCTVCNNALLFPLFIVYI